MYLYLSLTTTQLMSTKKKFKESLNTAVFTTRFVIESQSTIVFVSHDDDGDWQFLSEEGPVENEARIALLSEMIELDPTILDIADIPSGTKAFRDDQYSPWRIRFYSGNES